MAPAGGSVPEVALLGRWAFDQAFQDAVAGMAVVDADCRYRLVNPAFCRMLGRDAADLIGGRTIDVAHPDDAARTGAELLSGGLWWAGAGQARKQYVRPDGTVVNTLQTTTVLRDEAGRGSALLVQVLDIREAEEARGRVERRLQALLARSSELTLLLDSDGRLVYVSPASARVIGYEPGTVQGRMADELLHPDDRARGANIFSGHLEAPGHVAAHDFRILHRDGTWRRVEAVVTNLLDDPAIGAVVVNLRDVTDERRVQEQLAASERRFRSLVTNSWDIITVHAADGRYLYASPAVTAQLGYLPEQLAGTHPFRLVHPEDAHIFEELARTIDGSRPDDQPLTYRLLRSDGEWRWLESMALNRLDDPAVRGVVVTTRDVTVRVRREAMQEALTTLSGEALRGEPLEHLFQRATDLAAGALGVRNCAVSRFIEGMSMEVVSRHGPALRSGIYPVEIDGQPTSLGASALRSRASVVWRADHPDTGRLPDAEALGLHSGAAALVADGPEPYGLVSAYSTSPEAFTADDVSFLEAVANVLAAAVGRCRVEVELRKRALQDELTGLPNRPALLDRMRVALARLARHPGDVAVLFIDTDDFKLVNDSLGHAAGDRVVAAVAERIAGALRHADTVARFGGDEFVILCESTDLPTAEEVARRVHDALVPPIELGERRINLTASIGIATTADPATIPDDLLAQADTAMYAAKQAGKHRSVCFDQAMRRRVDEQLQVVSGLRQAVERSELRLFYQPVVRADTGAVVGAEALVRWQHPVDGLLGPDRFIGYAEASELILPLGEWVLSTACRQGSAWAGAGLRATVSINVSGRQLAHPGFADTVERHLAESGVPPDLVCLEVTESAVMADIERAASILRELRSLGVQVGVDDFGTGYSSLSYLADLEFDFVKIDQSFVSRYDQDRRAAALLETIAALCRSLDLPAVAEGVETDAQLAEVRRLGITYAQGYLFGRPMPVDQLPSCGRGATTAA